MAAAQKIKGREGIIAMTIGGTTEEIPGLTGWTLDMGTSLSTDSIAFMASNGDGGAAAGGDWETSEVESRNWSLSAEHVYQTDDLVGTTGILDATDVGASGTVLLHPDGDQSGGRTYSGAVILESASITSQTAETITVSETYKGTGPLTKGTVA